MINNRQGNRRRGRGGGSSGGQRPQGLSGGGGNRQDNRNRGNAAQLLEKYKSLARDTQLAGDRVQTEYYLQFADHYFRVLSETRSRFEEQRRVRGDEDDEDFDDDGMDQDGDDSGEQERFERQDRPDRPDRAERPDRSDRSRERGRERPVQADGDGERRPRFPRDDRGGARRERTARLDGQQRSEEEAEEPAAQIAFETLPPAIGLSAGSGADGFAAPEEEDAPRPRRRARRPRAVEGDEEVIPAA